MLIRTATAIINKKALQHNFSRIKQLAPKAKVLSVLKANAYGHGLVSIARALPDTDAIGVARIDEALKLRAGGITKPIVLMEGFFDVVDLPILVVNDFETVIHSVEQLEAIENACISRPLKCWLKVDTGMHRLGVTPAQFNEVYQRLNACPNVLSPILLMSHFACADDLSKAGTYHQVALFNRLTESLPEEKTLANSAAIIQWPQTQLSWIRPGLLLYGVSPLSEKTAEKFDFKPVMTLQSKLIAIREIGAGESVGYGAMWTSKRKTRIGVVAIGYGDGYPRHAVNGTPVLINGRIVPLVGRVSMDMITIDLGIESLDKVNDSVILWGEGLPVEKIAQCASTIPYELLCNITRRVQYELV